MEWIRSPLVFVALGAYALLLLSLLLAYFRKGEGERSVAAASARPEGAGAIPADRMEGEEVGDQRGSHSSIRITESDHLEFREEAEKLFSGEKDPVFVTDAEYQVFYRNRSARKMFGGMMDGGEEPLASVLGAQQRSLEKSLAKVEQGQVITVNCQLPSGKDGTAQMRFSIINRLPRIFAFRLVGLEEEKPSWLSKGTGGGASTSLTRGGHLDFREVDPASVELSADQMLTPLREIDDLLQNVSRLSEKEEPKDAKRSLHLARNKLRRLIRHIEEIDWMLQVNDGHLHQRPESFRGYDVIAGMAVAANRLAGADGPRLKLDPSEPSLLEPLLTGDRRIFEKIVTQLLTSAFRAADKKGIEVFYRVEALESPTQSDDWYLFADEGEGHSQSSLLTLRIIFQRGEGETESTSDLPAVVETLGAQIVDPRLIRRLDFVRKGRDSDLFGLTLARELVSELEGELAFLTGAQGQSEFVLKLRFENAG